MPKAPETEPGDVFGTALILLVAVLVIAALRALGYGFFGVIGATIPLMIGAITLYIGFTNMEKPRLKSIVLLLLISASPFGTFLYFTLDLSAKNEADQVGGDNIPEQLRALQGDRSASSVLSGRSSIYEWNNASRLERVELSNSFIRNLSGSANGVRDYDLESCISTMVRNASAESDKLSSIATMCIVVLRR